MISSFLLSPFLGGYIAGIIVERSDKWSGDWWLRWLKALGGMFVWWVAAILLGKLLEFWGL